MAPVKRFAKYSEDLQKVIAFLEESEPSKNVKKALTIVKRVQKSAAKYAGTGEEAADKKPRKLNNYMLFVMENRAKVVADMGKNVKPTDVTRKLGEMWQEAKATWEPKKGQTSTKAAPKKKAPSKKKGGEGQEDVLDF